MGSLTVLFCLAPGCRKQDARRSCCEHEAVCLSAKRLYSVVPSLVLPPGLCQFLCYNLPSFWLTPLTCRSTLQNALNRYPTSLHGVENPPARLALPVLQSPKESNRNDAPPVVFAPSLTRPRHPRLPPLRVPSRTRTVSGKEPPR